MKFIQNTINFIRTNDIKNFSTNFFTNNLHPIWVKSNKQAIIFVVKELDFYKLYYAYNNVNALDPILQSIPDFEGKLFLEIVSRNIIPNELDELLLQHFEYYKKYQMLYKNIELLNNYNNAVTNNSIVDVDKLYSLFITLFDSRFDHLMTLSDLQIRVNENSVIVINEDNKISSFLIYKVTGSKVRIEQLANFGGRKTMTELWTSFYIALSKRNIKYVDLWYDTTNIKAKKMYDLEHFKEINKFNYCYIKK